MRDKGIIKIVAVPNPVLFGYKAWAKIGIKVESGAAPSVASGLVANPLVYFVAYSLGRFDFVIAVNFKTIDELTHFSNFELTKIRGIVSSETMVLTQPRKYYGYHWEHNTENDANASITDNANIILREGNCAIDDADRAIVDLLKEDGLAKPTTLKTKLHIGEDTIRRRIRTMLRNNVFNLQVVADPRVLPTEAWVTIGITISRRPSNLVIDDILKNPSVYLASGTHGRFNIILAARFRSLSLLDHFVHHELLGVRGVSFVETFLHSMPLKYHYTTWSHDLG